MKNASDMAVLVNTSHPDRLEETLQHCAGYIEYCAKHGLCGCQYSTVPSDLRDDLINRLSGLGYVCKKCFIPWDGIYISWKARP